MHSTPEESGRPGAVPAGDPPCRILLVDDETFFLAALKRSLSRHHTVTTAPRATAALALLATESFDVILCDLWMPGMTGKAFQEELERRYPDAAASTIFLSGGASTAEMRAFLGGFEGRRLDKPVDMTELREVVERLAMRRRQRSGQTDPAPS